MTASCVPSFPDRLPAGEGDGKLVWFLLRKGGYPVPAFHQTGLAASAFLYGGACGAVRTYGELTAENSGGGLRGWGVKKNLQSL